MKRAEARRAGRSRRSTEKVRPSGIKRPSRTEKPISLKTGLISDEHPLAFVGDYAREFGIRSACRTFEAAMTAVVSGSATNPEAHALPADDLPADEIPAHVLPTRVGLSHATYLAATQDGLDPMTAVVYQPDVHGVCTLKELAQVTIVDLPAAARRAPLYWAVPTADAFLVGPVVNEMEILAEEGEQVIAAAPFEALFTVYSRERAETLFGTSMVKPQRLWPVAYEGRLEFMGMKGAAGHTAATLNETLAFLPENLTD